MENLNIDTENNQETISDDKKEKNNQTVPYDLIPLGILTFLIVGFFLVFLLHKEGVFYNGRQPVLDYKTPQNCLIALFFAFTYVGIWLFILGRTIIFNLSSYRVIFNFFTAAGDQGNANRYGALTFGIISLIFTIIFILLFSSTIFLLKFHYFDDSIDIKLLNYGNRNYP